IAASVVDFPEPVPPTMMTSPRFDSTTSFRTGGRSSSSKVGILALIRRMTQPMAACCTKALTRKRPMPGGAIAKLHSLVASNSLVWRSFMMARTSVADCSEVSARSDWGRISPSTLMAGGKPAVMKRSDAFFSVTRRSRSCISLMAWSRSICQPLLRPLLQRILVLRLVARLFLADLAPGDELGQALIERLHALRAAGLDGRVHLRDLALADQVTDRRRADHDLVRGDAPAAVLLQQRLRDDGAQRFRQHRAHHVLLLAGEDVDDAVDGLGGRAGMERAEHQVTGLGGRERQADGLEIAHFADQDDVGVLAQRRAQRLAEAERVAMHLALIDQAALGFVHELDRVLDGDDVIGTVVVAVVHHAGERGRLAGAGRTGDQHQPARQHAQVAEDLGSRQLVQALNSGGNVAKYRAG